MTQRILLVDECREILRPYKLILERQGYEVFTAENLSEATGVILQCAKEQNPIGAIVYDPESIGQFFLQFNDVASCVMHYDPDLRNVALRELGFARFLKKPFERRELDQVVAESFREANYRWN